MKLIVNADDLGFSKGINYGILEAYKNGIVRSTTLMMNVPFTNHAIELFKNEDIGIGVHLNITSGRSLLNTHKKIADEDRNFIENKGEINEELLKEIENEFEAQIQLAFDSGINITHLDSHHHIHMSNEEFFKLTKKLARKNNIPLRCNREYSFMSKELQENVVSTSSFSEGFYDKTVTLDFLMDILSSNLKEETLEVMVHPGFLCGNLIGIDSYREMRMKETSILTSKRIKLFISENNIELINYSQI